LAPIAPAFFRIASSISVWFVHSPEPVASMIAILEYRSVSNSASS
jgi:hypothetical protein